MVLDNILNIFERNNIIMRELIEDESTKRREPKIRFLFTPNFQFNASQQDLRFDFFSRLVTLLLPSICAVRVNRQSCV